jgi:hypothetical protein
MNTYATKDLGLIAALTLTIHYLEIDDSDPKSIVFIFEETPELLQIVDDYFNDRYMVSAMSYNIKLKQIKTRLYQTHNNQPGYIYK